MVAMSLFLPVATWEFHCFLFSVICCIDNNAIKSKGSETSVKVEVKRLDFGDTASLSLWNVKEMAPEMAALPLQAVQVSLAKVSSSVF